MSSVCRRDTVDERPVIGGYDEAMRSQFCRASILSLIIAATGLAATPSVDDLIRDLRTGTPQQQVAAADQLAHMGAAATPAIPALLNAMAGPSPWVGLAMMDALAELHAVSLPVLVEMFTDADVAQRLRIIRAFWSMGARAKEVRPLMVKLLNDENTEVRRRAQMTIAKIDAEVAEANVAAPVRAAERIAVAASPVTARDWPGFRGPRRDGLCNETGLLKEWPSDGPKLLWQLDSLGRGHSTIAIADGRFFTTGDRDQSQFLLAYDLATRAELWAVRIGAAYPEYGALSTPTIDGDVLYVVSTDGDLLCLETGAGKIRWQHNFTNAFAGKMMSAWKYSESPLVDGERLIATPGGKDAMMVAFNKHTGGVLWKCAIPALGERGSEGAAYSSAVVADIGGVRQYIQVVGRGIIGVAAETGEFLWGYNRLANTIASITTPVVRGNHVFTANSYNTGSALLEIKRNGTKWDAVESYLLPAKTFENHHGGIVLVGDHLYGGSGLNKGDPACLEFATGKLLWKPKAPAAGSACVLYADGHLIYRYDRGLVILVEATPGDFRIKSRFTPQRTNSPAWAYPVIHNRKLYLRDQQLLFCYDLAR
ncbi:MAG: polyvinylalcohol dehydrogenase [Verrucomicrobia bacterium]|nr:polyvinylalcohol dehydrogenase [Verrucomicrobiota bacterium]